MVKCLVKTANVEARDKFEWIKNHLKTETGLLTDVIPQFSFPAEKSCF